MEKQQSDPMDLRIDLTVGACIVFDKKILLMLHTKLGKWLFPGGHIESNETPDDAVLREVKEETGLNFKFLQFSPLAQTSGELKKLSIPIHANLHNVGDHNHYCIYFLGTTDSPTFIKNKESKELRWFSAKELKKLENVPEHIRKTALYAIELVSRMNKEERKI